MPPISTALEALIREFVVRVAAAAQAQANERVNSAIGAALSGVFPAPAASPKPSKTAGMPGRRKLRLSAKTLAVRKLQGRYLGLLRGLKPGVRDRVKRVAHEKGVAAAVKFAGSLK